MQADKLFLDMDKPDNAFAQHFKEYLGLLIRRRNRFLDIWTGNGTHRTGPQMGSVAFFDAMTYFDVLIVQLRAICVDGSKKNYTVQGYLNRNGDKIALDAMEDMLAQVIPIGDPVRPEMMPLRHAIRLLSDKTICHYDNFDVSIVNPDRERQEDLVRALLPFGDCGQVWWLGQLVDLIYKVTKHDMTAGVAMSNQA